MTGWMCFNNLALCNVLSTTAPSHNVTQLHFVHRKLSRSKSVRFSYSPPYFSHNKIDVYLELMKGKRRKEQSTARERLNRTDFSIRSYSILWLKFRWCQTPFKDLTEDFCQRNIIYNIFLIWNNASQNSREMHFSFKRNITVRAQTMRWIRQNVAKNIESSLKIIIRSLSAIRSTSLIVKKILELQYSFFAKKHVSAISPLLTVIEHLAKDTWNVRLVRVNRCQILHARFIKARTKIRYIQSKNYENKGEMWIENVNRAERYSWLGMNPHWIN